MSKTVEKKTMSEHFKKIEQGIKTYDLRLADWDCQPGDTLVLVEIDERTKQPTGRKLRRKVGHVGKTKGFNAWPEEDIEKYGFQVISLLQE